MATLTGYFADLESVTVHGHSLQVLQQGHSVAETPNIRGNVDHSSLSLPFCLVAFLSPILLQLQMVMALVRKSRHLYMNLLATPLLNLRQQLPGWRQNPKHWSSIDL